MLCVLLECDYAVCVRVSGSHVHVRDNGLPVHDIVCRLLYMTLYVDYCT